MRELTPHQQAQVERLLARAAEVPAEQRPRLLAGADADPAVRAEVASLLAARPAADQLFGRPLPAGSGLAALWPASDPDDAGSEGLPEEPRELGPYRILSRLGTGGMGVVYLAEQAAPLRRRVALKVIKPGLDTQAVLRRFAAERQALALLDHPNIAGVLEAGATAHGRPYFVMEHVAGPRITEYCDRERLSIARRLELFVPVCHAIQHAHQKGLIHRDIKPSNVLVACANGMAAPKVIDFGVAKAIHERLTEATLCTGTGVLIGTPQYMSPEQAGASADVDTRSDVYSLGVLLYELLVGALPLETGTAAPLDPDALRRAIREAEPVLPSTRVSSLGADADRVARTRGTDRAGLRRRLRGDLDWIVMKCLEKDRRRRYGTVAELVDDLTRYVQHRPVVAGPPSLRYRARKFARRNRGLVGAAAAVTVVLGAGAISTGAFAVRAARERSAAQTQSAIAQAVNEFLREMLLSVDPRAAGPDVTVRQVLDQAAAGVATEFAAQPAVERSVCSTIGRAYQALGLYDDAEPHLRRALDLAVALHGARHEETAQSSNELGYLYRQLGRWADAEALHRRALAIHRDRFGAQSLPAAESMNHLAQVLYDQGRFDEGRPLYVRALALRSARLTETDPALVTSLNNLARARYTDGDYAGAESLLRETLRLMREIHGDAHPDTVGQMNNVAFLVMARGRYAESEALFREAVAAYRALHGGAHPDLARALNNLGECVRRQGRLPEAAEVHRAALAMRTETLGGDHPDVATSLNNLGLALTELGEYEDATECHRRALAIRSARLGEDHPRVATSLANTAFVLEQQGRLAAARPLYEEALALRRAAYGDDHPEVANTQTNLARCLMGLGEWSAAEALCRAALRVQESQLGAEHTETRATRLGLGRVLLAAGRYEEAESVLLAALQNAAGDRRPPPAAAPHVARLLVELYEAWGRPERAAIYSAERPKENASADGGPAARADTR